MKQKEITNKKRTKQKKLLSYYIDRPVKFFIRHDINPNTLSYVGFLCSMGASVSIAMRITYYSIWITWIIPALMFIAGFFDVVDGEVARRTGQESRAGAFLDSNLDRISDAAIILGLILGGMINFLLGYIVMFLILMISYIRAKAENLGIDMRGIGIMERGERIILLIIAFVVEAWTYFLTENFMGTPFTILIPFVSTQPITWLFLIFILIYTSLLISTVFQRIYFTFKKLSSFKTNERLSKEI